MEAKLIIPLRDNDGTDNATMIAARITDMCRSFGGCTVYQAKGFWVDDAANLYQDEVTVIVASSTEEVNMADELRRQARMILELTDQKAVFMSIDGKAEIVE